MNLQSAWCRETSSDPDNWTPDNPAWGQCAVTALIVQDVLGGLLLRAEINGISHYWNELEDGTEPDLTRVQFGTIESETPAEERDRAYLLSYPDTAERYALLRRKVLA